MSHDDYPDMVLAPPRLETGQHRLDALGFGLAFSALRLYKKIRVYHQIFQRLPAAYQIGPVQNVSGSGRHFVHIQMNHVSVQKINIGCQLLVGIGGGVGFAQQQVYQVCYMLVLVRNFEREVAYKAFRVAHDAAGQVVQKIRFSAVGHTGHDDQAACVGGMENAVGQGAVAHAVAVVVFAVQHIHHLFPALFYSDDIGGVAGTGIFYDALHHFGAVKIHHIAYVFASSGQGGEKAACSEVVGQMFHQCASGQVGVTADHDVLHLVQPGSECLELFARLLAAPEGTLMTWRYPASISTNTSFSPSTIMSRGMVSSSTNSGLMQSML